MRARRRGADGGKKKAGAGAGVRPAALAARRSPIRRLRQSLRHRGAARARCRSGAIRRSAPPTGFTPSSSPGPPSRRRATPTAAAGCTASVRRPCTAASRRSPPGGSSARFDEVRAAAESAALGSPPIPRAPTDFLDGPRDARRQRLARIAGERLRHPLVRCEPLHGGALLLRRGRRAADRAAARGRCVSRTELGRHRGPRRRRSRSFPRGLRFRVELLERQRARLRVRELRRAAPAPGSRSDRRQWSRQSARLPDAGAPGTRTVPGTSSWWRSSPGNLWAARIDHSPLDVVAWHGNYAPYRYDLRRFNTIGSVSYDHPDPSIFLVLQSPSDTAGRRCASTSSSSRRAGWSCAGHVPPAVVPPQCRQRVHGPDRRGVRRQGGGFRTRAAPRSTTA